MIKYRNYLMILTLWSVSFIAHSKPLQPQEVPNLLQPWVNWVLHEHENRRCPFHYYDQTARVCHWPSRLAFNVNALHAEFHQEWQVYNEGWISLPGDTRHWPQEVKVNDVLTQVADHGGTPKIFSPPGRVVVQGQFKWERRPEYLQIPTETGLVSLTIDNQAETFPDLDSQGRLWLHREEKKEQVEADRLDLHVYRKVTDDIPLQVTTQIDLDVAGRHREVLLGPTLLEKHIAMSLTSPLPARLEPDGRLRLQVRPGTWTLTLHSRSPGLTYQLPLLPVTGLWVPEETWVFEAQNQLRMVEIEGVNNIDPQQTTLPQEWKQFPTYQIKSGETFKLVEKRRGDSDPSPDQLRLTRHFWLDFDGRGYSVQDKIEGTMTHAWRLEMAPPAILGRVNMNRQDQFITRLEDSSSPGVEVRTGQVNLIADSRLDEALHQLPAVGWKHDFQQVSATLHLPPGWRLIHALGVDDIPSTWLRQWTLLDLFVVLMMAVAMSKLWNWQWGMLGLVTLILLHREPGAPYWIWLHIIVALALLRVLPEVGRFSALIRSYRNLALVILLIAALPFMKQQLQQSIYPQLEREWETLGDKENLVLNAEPAPPPSPADGEAHSKAQEETKGGVQQQAKQDWHQEGNMSLGALNEVEYEKVQKSLKRQQQLEQIDPNMIVQTGPGLPQWGWMDTDMYWNGPVEQNQQIDLWLLSPNVTRLLGFVRVLLLATLIVFLLKFSWTQAARQWFTKKVPIPATGMVVLVCLLCLPLFSLAQEQTVQSNSVMSHEPIAEQSDSQADQFGSKKTQANGVQAHAQDTRFSVTDSFFPPPSLLEELQQRLLAPPDCLPACANSPRMKLELEAQSLKIRMEIHSFAITSIPLPGNATEWLARQIWINDQPAQSIWKSQDGQLWIAVEPGIHQIFLEGDLPPRTTVQLPLPLKPHFIETQVKGWQIEGIHENGVADDSLQFTRTDETRLEVLDVGTLPPFVQIQRTLFLGLDWQIETRVTRLTPTGSAVVLEIPLLEGESVTSEKVRVQAKKVLINLSSNETEMSWESVLNKQETIKLVAPDNTFSHEIWRLNVGTVWHAEIEGIPVIHHQSDQGDWLPEWRPWPKEEVTLHLIHPQGTDGQILTIDGARLNVTPGQRSTENKLTLTLRSSRGGQHSITLPQQTQLLSIFINGSSQPIRQEGQQVILPIQPGSQQVELSFRQSVGTSQRFYTPSIGLGAPSVNTHVEVTMPPDRWILWVGGPPMGPAITIWGILLFIALASIGLSKISLTPLKFHHWFLLGVVISQVDVVLIFCIIAWFIVLGWRAQRSPSDFSAFRFDMIQIGIGILTVIALSILIMAIKQGLLGQPEMQIVGNGSYGHELKWYEDRTSGNIPQVWIFSWSIWVYRILMLLWALWVAFALIRWSKWGWNSFSHQGIWEPIRKKKAIQTE